MTQQEASVGTARTLEEELLRALARQTRRVPIPVFLATLMIAALAAQKVPVAAWGGWLLLVAITLVIRRSVLWRLPRMTGYTDREKLRIAILLNVANGVVHGLSLLFIPFLPEFERAIQSMILVGLCAGAVATNVGYMPVLLGYLVPTLPRGHACGPLCGQWAEGARSDRICTRGHPRDSGSSFVRVPGPRRIGLVAPGFHQVTRSRCQADHFRRCTIRPAVLE